GLALALRNGATLALDLDWYEHVGRSSSAPREYELDAFNIRARRYRPPLPRRLLRRPAPNPFDERHFHFDPAVAELGGDVHLRGHFQTERYFGDAEQDVRKDLSFRAPPEGVNA